MKAMENKQKAIEKAYGEHWETVKDYVDENGWVKRKDIKQIDLVICDLFDVKTKYFTDLKENDTVLVIIRPKSLQGIETNNGWLDFSVLPNDDKIYYFTAKNNFIFNVPQSLRMVIEKFINKEITHYYPIEQPKQKIY